MSTAAAAQEIAKDQDQDDKILAAANDVIGLFNVISFGRVVYVRLLGALGLILAASAMVMISARTLGRLVEAVVEGRIGADTSRLGVTFLSLEAAAVATQYFGRVSLAHATIEITFKIRQELFGKMQRLPIAYFDSQPLGRTITRMTADVEGIETFFSGTMARVLIAVINICTVLVAMLMTNLSFGMMTVAASVPAMIFSVALRKPVRHWLRTYKRKSAYLNAKLAEFLNGIAVIRIFGLERWTQRIFDQGAAELLRAGILTMNWNSFIRPLAVFLCSIPTLLIIAKGGDNVLAGTMELGMLVTFVRYSERFVSPIRILSQEVQNIQEALVSSERVRRMLTEPEEKDTLGLDGELTPELSGEIEYRDVWMSYAPGQHVLKGVTFSARPGMKIGLVGHTGSGKTTTVNLLPRLYPFSSGQILLDGVPIEKLARRGLRGQLGYVSQEIVVFSGTIRENLLAARQGAEIGQAELTAACDQTGLTQVLRHFDDGLEHKVLEGGDNLSMGERQLIAFTRMVLRDPKILVLDEATANIDERCERLIQSAIAEVMAGRTCFVIAHRLSTIIQCDLILVFRAGEIVEQGTHLELMARGGYYAALAGKQLA